MMVDLVMSPQSRQSLGIVMHDMMHGKEAKKAYEDSDRRWPKRAKQCADDGAEHDRGKA